MATTTTNDPNSAPIVTADAHRPLFTVFTPTFNRAHTLSRTYRSLCAQTFRDFEWLVVDDGSTDNTKELLEGWELEGAVRMRHLSQENSGKHVAFNRAVREAQGELFLTLDSDDECIPEALARLRSHWLAIPQPEREKFSAVTGLCVDQFGALVGDRFPKDVIDCSTQELRYRYRIAGDKWGFQRTEVLRAFPFPEPKGAKLIPEGVVWAAISRKYITRYVNEVLLINHRALVPNTSLSTQTDPRRHAIGGAISCRSVLNEDIAWCPAWPSWFAMTAVLYTYFSLLAGDGLWQQFRSLKPPARLLWLVVLPASLLKYLRDRFVRKTI